jgi:hypothetical protein
MDYTFTTRKGLYSPRWMFSIYLKEERIHDSKRVYPDKESAEQGARRWISKREQEDQCQTHSKT